MTLDKCMHPWNFKITPSMYLKHQERMDVALERAIKEIGGIAALDNLFEETLKCPPLRKLDQETFTEVQQDGILDTTTARELVLVVSYAKPAIELVVPNPDRVREIMSDLGIITDKYSESNCIVASYSPSLVKLIMENGSMTQKEQRTTRAFSIIGGIAFGYPLGDAIEFVNGSCTEEFYQALTGEQRERLAILSHISTPLRWNNYWKDKVGIEGEFKLAGIYRSVLYDNKSSKPQSIK